jgi:hypothetical protein
LQVAADVKLPTRTQRPFGPLVQSWSEVQTRRRHRPGPKGPMWMSDGGAQTMPSPQSLALAQLVSEQ